MVYTSKESVLQWMRGVAKPALHVIAAESKSWSKIGGLPNLGDKHLWPSWKGNPLSFLAQLDFAEIATRSSLPDLPKTGRVFFFYDQEQSTWGFDPKDAGSWKVIFQDANSDFITPVPAPEGLGKQGLYTEKPICFRSIESLPDFGGRIKLDYKVLSEPDLDELIETKSRCFGRHPRHQIGGYPSAVQHDGMELESQMVSNGLYCGNKSALDDPRRPELEKDAGDWTLLLQLDSDDGARMMWGDVGMLYFWIRRQDLARSDFSKVWMILQCC